MRISIIDIIRSDKGQTIMPYDVPNKEKVATGRHAGGHYEDDVKIPNCSLSNHVSRKSRKRLAKDGDMIRLRPNYKV